MKRTLLLSLLLATPALAATSPSAFPEDTSASLTGTDADANGIRDDIDAAIATTVTSSRTRGAVQQLARAYQNYFAAPSKATALAAEEQSYLTDACLARLPQAEQGDAKDLVESLLFNTPQRTQALDQLPVHAGPRTLSAPAVALDDPATCAAFMPQ